MSDLHWITAAEAAQAIAARKLSPVELTEAYLRRIATLDSQLDSFVTLTAERARAWLEQPQSQCRPVIFNQAPDPVEHALDPLYPARTLRYST